MPRPLQDPESKFNSICPAPTTVAAFLFPLVLTLAATQAVHAQTFRVIHSFTGADGEAPQGLLAVDPAGNLYDTTANGGSNDASGTVFELSPSGPGWTLATLHVFNCAAYQQANCDGEVPHSGVMFGPNGALYGTTCCGGGLDALGVTFELTPTGTGWMENVLYHFPYGPDGNSPSGPLAFDAQGHVYGTTTSGGVGGGGGKGVVYQLTPANGRWRENVLWTFAPNGGDGVFPEGVIFDNAGNLYGVTYSGGRHNCGTVYELLPSPSGWTQEILYNFRCEIDGAGPVGIVFDQSGNLFGATNQGGPNGGGTIFELTPAGGQWQYRLTYALSGRYLQGGPWVGPAIDGNGNLYGTTWADGTYGLGNVFKLTRAGDDWQYTDLYDFRGGPDGAYPLATPAVDAKGNVYGTTVSGGEPVCVFSTCGVVFEITP